MSGYKMVLNIGMLIFLILVTFKSATCCKSDKYEVINSKGTWSEAFIDCKKRGLMLATIESKEEEKEIEKVLDKCNFAPGWNAGPWISLRNAGKYSTAWYWTSNGKLMNYSNWGPGQPDSKKETCVQMYIADSGKWKWNNLVCETKRHFQKYICQKPKCESESN